MTIPVTDRELLELAAKAAGQIQFDPFRSVFRHVLEMGFLGEDWNPLTDDGDALRLAAQCEISFGIARSSEFLRVVWWVSGQLNSIDEPEPSRFQSLDTLAWLRRAIVRAAAEIGRAMP
jgi:hypothetical protein